jgi:hypothetical protein
MKLKTLSLKTISAAAAAGLLLASCAPAPAAAPTPAGPPDAVLTIVAATFAALTPSPVPSATAVPPTAAVPPTITPTATPDTRMTAKYWPEYPIVPKAGEGAKAIYALGQKLGNNPRAYSVVGDCQSDPDVFMGTFDTDRYRLSDTNLPLQETIDYFKGYFGHQSVTVRDGLSVSSALSPLWSNPAVCQPNETPLACEYRLTKPSFVIINLGTNWKSADLQAYENYLRQIVDFWVKNGVVPILSTKVDDLEGGHKINQITAQVAYDFDIPVWNFYRATENMPNHGLDPLHDPTGPLVYLSTDAWYIRSVTGLQALDSVWRGVAGLPPAGSQAVAPAVQATAPAGPAAPTLSPQVEVLVPTLATLPAVQ